MKGAFLCSPCRAKLQIIRDWALRLICFKKPQVHLDVIEEIGLITLWSNETPPIGYGYTSHWITNRRVLTTLNFEVRPRGKPFMWKWVISAWEYKIVSYQRFNTYNYLTQLWIREIREGALRHKWMQFNIENCVSLVISELERIITSFFEGAEPKTTRIRLQVSR